MEITKLENDPGYVAPRRAGLISPLIVYPRLTPQTDGKAGFEFEVHLASGGITHKLIAHAVGLDWCGAEPAEDERRAAEIAVGLITHVYGNYVAREPAQFCSAIPASLSEAVVVLRKHGNLVGAPTSGGHAE